MIDDSDKSGWTFWTCPKPGTESAGMTTPFEIRFVRFVRYPSVFHPPPPPCPDISNGVKVMRQASPSICYISFYLTPRRQWTVSGAFCYHFRWDVTQPLKAIKCIIIIQYIRVRNLLFINVLMSSIGRVIKYWTPFSQISAPITTNPIRLGTRF